MQPPGKPPGKRSQLPLGQGPDSFLDVAGALPALDEVLLPGDRRPPPPPPVDDDPVDMEELAELESRMAKFASGVSVANKRHEIRKLTAPAEGAAKSRLTLGEDEPAPLHLARTQKVLSEDDTADRLSAFAEKVAVRAKDPRFMALAKESAKQAIIDNLNPVIAISANLAEAGMRANALRDWKNLSDGERVLQVAGLAGNVAEILSAVTPPPAGPAFKVFGIGMMLIKVAADANTPKREKTVPQAPSPARRGTQMLRAPSAPTATPRSPTGALTPPPQLPTTPRPVSKTGPLSLPTPPVQPPRPVAKTGPLPALPEEAPKEESAILDKLKAFGKQLKDFF